LSDTRDEFDQRRTKLSLHFSEEDRIAAGRFVRAVSRTFGLVGIGRVRSFIAERFAPWPPRKISWGNHHMGTTRMSDDPKRGVVDKNLRMHSVSNVFIAGSSVFPTGGHVPPTLTIVALSLRLADHLMAEAP
jgi:choline dehydrogenase-like flavoprotein